MKHLSAFEKREIVRLCTEMTSKALSERFEVSLQTVKRLFKRLREAGISVPVRKKGRPRKLA